jgi:hypothetical protein
LNDCSGGERGVVVKFAYETAWKRGTIHAEAGSLDELSKIAADIQESNGTVETESSVQGEHSISDNYPQIGGRVGCADALRTLLASEWGKTPRTEYELTEAMKANAIHYQRGTISGLLTNLTRKGELRRVGKKNGSYAYAINRNRNPENQDN